MPRRRPGERGQQPFPSKQALLSTAGGCGTALRTPTGKVYALGSFAKSRSSSLWSRQHTLDDDSAGRNRGCILGTKVCGCGLFELTEALYDRYVIPIQGDSAPEASYEPLLKRKRLSAPLVGMTV